MNYIYNDMMRNMNIEEYCPHSELPFEKLKS